MRFILCALTCALGVHAHGFLANPKSRNVMSRTDHYCPHCFNSGGTGAVSANSGGVWPYPETLTTTSRHGICGDPLGEDSHAYAGDVVATYSAGGKIEIEIGITAHHNGHFEFFLCDTADLADETGPVSQECLNRHQLKRSPDLAEDTHHIDPRYPGRYYLDPKCSMPRQRFSDAGIDAWATTMTYDLPEGLTCEHCVLQMYWITANSCLAPGYREYFGSSDAPTTHAECSGDGGSSGWWAPHLGDCKAGSYPEEFWNCTSLTRADIKILPSTGTTPPSTSSSTPPPIAIPTAPPSPTSNDDGSLGEAKRVVAYVPNWKACPAAEQLKHYTHALVAFAVTYPAWKPAGVDTCATDRSCTVQAVPGCGGKTLSEMVDYLHANGVKAILSFGGASMGGVWETKGAAGSNSCWEHCLDKTDNLVEQLRDIVQQNGLDGLDVDYEYFLDEPKYRTFLSDVTEKLRAALPSPLLLTHAPMDPDLCTTGVHPGCRREYYDILAKHSEKVDFIMPQYYNGFQRPAQDFASALQHYNALVSDVFKGDASKVVFGFCISDCSSFNVNAASALGVVRSLEEAVPENGGAMFWETSADGGGAWSGPIAQLYGGDGNGDGDGTTTLPPSTPPVSGCTGEPCFVEGHCRSEWGWCGSTSEYCNARSQWSPECVFLGEPTLPPSISIITSPPSTVGDDEEDGVVPPGSFVAQHGKLRIDGVQIVDASGAPVQLLGMSSHGLHWFKDCYTKESIAHLVSSWGITLFRAAMYIGEGGYATDRSVQKTVEDIVRWTEELGVYVIIDWHVLTPGDPNAWLDGKGASTGLAIDFWEEMAFKYKSKQHVLFEIANEPNNVDWPTVKAYHDAVIGAIRKIDPTTVIIAGTTTWSQDIHLAAQDPVNLPLNVAYAFHFYAGTHRSLLQRVRDTATRIPIFSTEWGTSEASGDGGPYLDVAREFLDLFAELKISWAQWSFADKGEVSAALWPGACSSKRWDETSASGTFVRNYINKQAGGGETTKPPTTTSPPTSPPTLLSTLPPTMPGASQPPPPPASSDCEHLVTYEVQTSWRGGYNVDVSVEAGPNGLAKGWSVSWALGEGNSLSQGWNGIYDFDESTRMVHATPAAWMANLAPGAVATFGATIAGSVQKTPTTFNIGDTVCVVVGEDASSPPSTVVVTLPPSTTSTPTSPATTDPNEELIAKIVTLLEELRDSGDEETANMAQGLIDELTSSRALTLSLARTMSSALLASYPGRGLPANPLDETSKQITNELLATLGDTTTMTEHEQEVGEAKNDGEASIWGLSPSLFVGIAAGSACALLALAVGLTVFFVKRHPRKHDTIAEEDGDLDPYPKQPGAIPPV